ncbi:MULTISPECIES: hypothetical protein [Nocardioides]|uniref:DUF4064 domain-containing protein n=1 Tax=Nocardioides vastitatis TaxID=2568655 RepID=A0ABW0ZF66_9ACTN|nr:hypothetical protein [Nocardioides sp.]THI99270.1 hypothetical protein E7Z54_12905 [Nocardioides sp.]
MSQETQPRPGQATLAGALIIGGSIVVLLAAWQRISTLHTIESQESLRQALSRPPLDSLGLSLEALEVTVRVLCLIAAGAATAAAILGFQVFKRSTSARIGLSVLAPLLLVGGFATEGFFAPMVVAGITLLWLQPTRDWYAGRPWLQRYEERRAERLAAIRSPARTGQDSVGAPTPPAAPPVAPTEPGLQGVLGAEDTILPDASHGQHQPGVVRRRPPALVWACALTWVTSGLVAAGLVVSALAMTLQRDESMAEIRKQQGEALDTYGLTEAQLLAGVYVVLGALVLWALAAIVVAYLTFRGHNWARITLAVSSAVAGATCLALALGNPGLIVLVVVLATCTWLLLRADVTAWFQR